MGELGVKIAPPLCRACPVLSVERCLAPQIRPTLASKNEDVLRGTRTASFRENLSRQSTPQLTSRGLRKRPGVTSLGAKSEAGYFRIEIETCRLPMAAKFLNMSARNQRRNFRIVLRNRGDDFAVTVKCPVCQSQNLIRIVRVGHQQVSQRRPCNYHRGISAYCPNFRMEL